MAREWRVHPDYVRQNFSSRQLDEMRKVLEQPSNTEYYIAWAILNITGAWVDNSGKTVRDYLLFDRNATPEQTATPEQLVKLFGALMGNFNNGQKITNPDSLPDKQPD